MNPGQERLASVRIRLCLATGRVIDDVFGRRPRAGVRALATVPPDESPMLLTRLKTVTQAKHEQLERDLDLLRPELSRLEYRQLLAQFYGFYEPWERAAGPLLDSVAPAFWLPRRKTPWLTEDLLALGCGADDLAAIPLCPSLPRLDTIPCVAGSLYVLEGATLGGQILSRHFAQTLRLPRGAGDRFFSGYRESTGAHWREFGQFLATVSSPSDDDQIVRSAVATFDALHAWLCETKQAAA